MLSGLQALDMGGITALKVYGTTDKVVTDMTEYNDKQIYDLNVIYIDGNLELNTELAKAGKVKIEEQEVEIGKKVELTIDNKKKEIDLTDIKVVANSDGTYTYSVGSQNDVASGTSETQMAKRGVVLKVVGDFVIGDKINLTSVASSRRLWRTKRNVYILQWKFNK